MKKFIRRVFGNYSKLGRRRKKKQVWRRPGGRDNKMREKLRGYPASISVGYKNEKKTKYEINDKKPVLVNNLKELEKVGKDNLVIFGNIGKKKKMELVKKAKEMKVEIYNLNVKKFEKKTSKKKTEKTTTKATSKSESGDKK